MIGMERVSRHSAQTLMKICSEVPISTPRGPIATAAAYDVAYYGKENPNVVPSHGVCQQPSCNPHTKW